MTNNQDYRLYLEKSFEILNDKLDRIETQVTKTNLRVDRLEGCVGDINKELEEYRMIKKYPKTMLILISVFVVGIIISAVNTIQSIKSRDRQTQIIDQINELKYPELFNPRGEPYDPFAKDSISK